MNNDNLYNILELKNTANINQIKQQFKKLALKFHPDKNKSNNANQKFNQIRVAYEILSDTYKKNKYDNMTLKKQQHFIDILFSFIREITNPITIQNLLCREDILDDIKNGNINKIAQKMIHKILDNIDIDTDIDKLNEIFLHSPIQEKQDVLNYTNNSLLSTSDYNTLNIFGNIKTTLDDIYHNRLKEITIKRKIYELNNKINTEKLSYNVPLYDNKIIITGAGDKSLKDNKVGNVILKVFCIKKNNILRDEYNLIYNENITLFELFNGINRNINHFNTIINIKSDNPLEEYHFDGNKITINFINKGLPYNQTNNRGKLIINFNLIKTEEFNNKLQKYFNSFIL
jgi:DnaJ-class molecular chaperone